MYLPSKRFIRDENHNTIKEISLVILAWVFVGILIYIFLNISNTLKLLCVLLIPLWFLMKTLYEN